MVDPLRQVFAEDLRRPEDADILAARARGLLPTLTGSQDDSPEDMAVRLRDPRIFGTFVGLLLPEEGIGPSAKIALAEHAFDLLPLPGSEGDVILVGSRAPPRLLALAGFLSDEGRLTVLHVMHVLFAVFLDPSLVTNVDRRTRTRLLESVVAQSETSEPVRLLYAGLHVASVPEAEAHATLERLLRGGAPDSLKRVLAGVVAAADGGAAQLVAIAREEGLLASGAGRPLSSSELASVPRMPARLAALGRRWLARVNPPERPRGRRPVGQTGSGK